MSQIIMELQHYPQKLSSSAHDIQILCFVHKKKLLLCICLLNSSCSQTLLKHTGIFTWYPVFLSHGSLHLHSRHQVSSHKFISHLLFSDHFKTKIHTTFFKTSWYKYLYWYTVYQSCLVLQPFDLTLIWIRLDLEYQWFAHQPFILYRDPSAICTHAFKPFAAIVFQTSTICSNYHSIYRLLASDFVCCCSPCWCLPWPIGAQTELLFALSAA